MLALLFSSNWTNIVHLFSSPNEGVAIRAQYYSCLHSPSWCNPSFLLLTYLVWWLVGCYWTVDRHTPLHLSFFYSRPIQLLFCQYRIYTHERYERLTVMYIVFFFFFSSSYVRSYIYYEHVLLSLSLSRRLDRGEQMHIFLSSKIFSFCCF